MCTGDRRATLDREPNAIVLTIMEVYPPQPSSAPSCAGGTFPVTLTLDLTRPIDTPLRAIFHGQELPVTQPSPLPTETATATQSPTPSPVRPSPTPTVAPQDYPPTPVGYDPNATLPPPTVSPATPNPGLSDRERIDRYWSDVDDVSCVGMVAPQSLEELEARSDLIVVGRPAGAQDWPGAPYPAPNALITFAVTDALKRVPNFPAPPTSIQLYVENIPSGTVADIEHLLFVSVVPRDGASTTSRMAT